VEDAWARCAPHILSEPEAEQQVHLSRLMESPHLNRYGWLESFQDSEVKEKKALREHLGLSPDRPVALLLPNLTFDSTLLTPTVNTVFKDSHDWVHKTVSYFVDHPHLQLIIRPHPKEKVTETNDPTQGLVLSEFSELPDNIFLIDTHSEINTYGLIEISDLGIVYITDCGFEMVLRSKPVITCGRAKFSDKGITLEPKNLEEYYGMLDRFSEDRNAFPVSKEQKEKAAFFEYFLWNNLHQPFPWRPAGIWGNMKDFPMETVLSYEGGAPFRESFSIISGADPSLYGVVGKTRILT
jgi:hypothetical protein